MGRVRPVTQDGLSVGIWPIIPHYHMRGMYGCMLSFVSDARDKIMQIPYSLAKLVQSTVEPLSSIGQRPYSYFLSETLA
jgi:hypothetical protein